jgi:hypothetical protein
MIMGALDNFASSVGVGDGVDFGKAMLDTIFGIQNKGLLGRKVARLYFTDLARPMASFDSKTMSVDVKKRAMPDVEVYIDPQSVKVSKKVLWNKKQTKGGWVFQFWGHDLTTISLQMKTGWFGYTKGQNLLTMIGDFAKASQTIQDMFMGGGKTSTPNGTSNGIYKDPLKVFQKIKNNVYNRRFDSATPFVGFPLITLVYEGSPYMGFFNNFDYDIDSNNPFNINFNFAFTVVPTNNKLLFEQAIQNVISKSSGQTTITTADIGNFALFSAGAITNPSGTVQKLFQGGVDWAIQTAESTLNDLTGNLGFEGLFDDIFPSKEELD